MAVRNDAAQQAYERTKHASLVRGWEGGLDAGLDLTRGNSDMRDFRFALRAARKVGRDRLSARQFLLFRKIFHSSFCICSTRRARKPQTSAASAWTRMKGLAQDR